jgi:hypothetical protein
MVGDPGVDLSRLGCSFVESGESMEVIVFDLSKYLVYVTRCTLMQRL